MDASAKTAEDLDQICEDAATAFVEGRLKKARELYLEALQTCDGLMDDEYRMPVREYLGVCCYRLGKFSEAARHDRETLKLLAKARGGGGRRATTIRHNLALDLSAIHDRDSARKLDELKEAVALHRQNLETLQSQVNRKEDYLETEYSLAFDLAKLSKASDDHKTAEQLLEEAASLNQKVVQYREQKTPNDSLTIKARHNFASVLYRQGNFSKAKELFLRNQHDLDALSSADKEDLVELLQSTDRYIAACCEATKDIALSIAQIRPHDRKGSKRKSNSKTNNDDSGSSVLDVVKANRGPKAEPDGKLWTLPVEKTNANTKPKVTPTGLATTSTPLQSEEAWHAGAAVGPAAWSGVTATGHSQMQNGHIFGNVTNNFFLHPPSLDGQHLPIPPLSIDLDAPTSEGNGIKRSKSQGHAAREDGSLLPVVATRPRSASSVRANTLAPQENRTRSRSISNLDYEDRKTTQRESVEVGSTSSRALNSSGSSRERGNREANPSRARRHSSSLTPGHSSGSRSSSDTREVRNDNSRGDKEKPRKVAPITHGADRWFADLREHTHALLHYNTKSEAPHRRRIRVAIIDSGVDRPANAAMRRNDIKRHSERLCRYRDFSGEAQGWADSDASLHGTNCASILLQVAPQADLYVANVVKKSTGNPSPSSVSAALEWALEKEVDIISLSLGFDKMHEDISKQIDLARLNGVLVFAAASNDGPNAPDWGVFPAWLSNVFCINSSDTSGAISWFNPKYTDEKLNFMFLGEEIAILAEDGTPLPNLPRLTGTSFATPIAAGTAALVLDLVRLQNIENEFPKIEVCLKTYEGMSSIFKNMSSPPTAFGAEFYNVRPWRLLGKKGPPLSRANEPNETKQWYTLLKVVECLKKFGDLDTGI